ncbi:hypothetical protein MRY87_06070 [bacterium]|nr:hypothetical protein [bacterium]
MSETKISKGTAAEDPDNTLVLRPSPFKWGILLALCLGFTVFCLVMAWMNGAAALIGAAFFAVGSLICLLQLLPNGCFLELSSTGFTFCSIFRERTITWEDVAEFGIHSPSQGMKVVCIKLNSHSKSSNFRTGISSALSGWDIGLPDTYGRSAEQLLSLMEKWKEHHSN